MDRITLNAKEMYDEFRFGHFSYGHKREKYASLLFDFLSMIKEGNSLFDIGCGSGFWMDTYLRCGISRDQITGIDLSPTNIGTLRKRGFNALCDDVLNLRLEDNISDFTICSGVIHHTRDPFGAFSELVRITKPGGYIYLAVYNKWNPYFYIIHRATYPIRYCYWNWDKNIVNVIYPLSKILFQPLSYLVLVEFLDNKTGRTLFMDQVITPCAHLFSKSTLISYAKRCNCHIQQFRYNKYYLILASIIKVNLCG